MEDSEQAGNGKESCCMEKGDGHEETGDEVECGTAVKDGEKEKGSEEIGI